MLPTNEIALAITTIKTLHSLSADLLRGTQGSKFASEVSEIQIKIGALSSQFFEIQQAAVQHERDAFEAKSRLEILNREISGLKEAALEDAKKIKELSEELSKHEINERKYETKYGCIKLSDRDGLFCPKCYLGKNLIIPVYRMMGGGFACTVCDKVIKC